MRSVGLDFGTTNSAIGVADGDRVTLARFAHNTGPSDTFRSILYFHPDASRCSPVVEGPGLQVRLR